MVNPLCHELLFYQPTSAEVGDFYSWYTVNCILNAFLTITAIGLNGVTIQALRKTSALSKPLKTMLLSLAVSDLGVGLFAHPFNIGFLIKWLQKDTENYPTCAAYTAFTFLTNLLSKASFFSIAALSIDRFLAIHLHLRYQQLVTYKRAVAAVIVLWVLSAFFVILRLSVSTDISYVVFAVNGVVCYVVSALLYYRIYLAVKRHKKQLKTLQVGQIEQNGDVAESVAKESKSAIGTFYVYLVFLACYSPHSFSLAFVVLSGSTSVTKVSTVYTWILVLFNSSLNPIVYCWKLRPVRRAVVKILQSFKSQMRKAFTERIVSLLRL